LGVLEILRDRLGYSDRSGARVGEDYRVRVLGLLVDAFEFFLLLFGLFPRAGLERLEDFNDCAGWGAAY
jgi:hypothetical protein